MEKKKFKLGLLPKLLIAIVLGIIIGQFFLIQSIVTWWKLKLSTGASTS